MVFNHTQRTIKFNSFIFGSGSVLLLISPFPSSSGLGGTVYLPSCPFLVPSPLSARYNVDHFNICPCPYPSWIWCI